MNANITILDALLCRWPGNPSISDIIRLAIRPDMLMFKKCDRGYMSCKRFTEIFPHLAYLKIGIGDIFYSIFPFSEVEGANSEMVSQLLATSSDVCLLNKETGA